MTAASDDLKVLVVDDEAHVRDALGGALQLVDIPVLLAGTGREALALLRDDARIGVLVTDLRMP